MGFELDLDLEGVEVLECSRTSQGDYVIALQSTRKTEKCRRCGHEICCFKGYDDWIKVRHYRSWEKRFICGFAPVVINALIAIKIRRQRKFSLGVLLGNPTQKPIKITYFAL